MKHKIKNMFLVTTHKLQPLSWLFSQNQYYKIDALAQFLIPYRLIAKETSARGFFLSPSLIQSHSDVNSYNCASGEAPCCDWLSFRDLLQVHNGCEQKKRVRWKNINQTTKNPIKAKRSCKLFANDNGKKKYFLSQLTKNWSSGKDGFNDLLFSFSHS